MNGKVRRIYVEKKKGYDVQAKRLLKDLKDNLELDGLQGVRILNRYDITGISDEEFLEAKKTIFSQPTVDMVYDETIDLSADDKAFAMEYLPGQYDQRADSAAQCMQILSRGKTPIVKYAKVIILSGNITEDQFKRVKEYCINPVDSREVSFDKPDSLESDMAPAAGVKTLDGFIQMTTEQLGNMIEQMGLAMTLEDLEFCRDYFRDVEKRDPTVTEIRVIDTYWSDHCRHTTFFTSIEDVAFEEGRFTDTIKQAYQQYLKSRSYVYGDKDRDICLMDIALMAMKGLRKKGMLDDLDVSDEVNACSISVDVDVDGQKQQWLVMFKNETHNHPTEIEPFGGAATCLGGAIRDPLSGRSYVYQAMRVTGSADPRTPVEETLPGKLPQRKITTEAADGYSSYGNQVGVATGHVAEIYHQDYVAKRMELGAVIGAAPRENVVRQAPEEGDAVILLGGRTGRDGCGGATGSSKEHTEESILTCGAEVQKGNPPTERNIQRLFRNPKVSKMIKKCNDFGAGGVSVAIGELADGLLINLDLVPQKYDGLDGTELAISESQERMAVVVAKEDKDVFIDLAGQENLEATQVAEVTSSNRMQMLWRGERIVDISRDFLNTNGAKQSTRAVVKDIDNTRNYFKTLPSEVEESITDIKQAWMANLGRLNVCSQKGMVEKFDSSVGAGTVLMPFGGMYQATPAQLMAAKIPVMKGDTTTGTLMSHGFDPFMSQWSPFHGAVYAIIDAVTKIVAAGGDYKKVRLTLQEYFEKLGKDPEKWGRPLSALLGAYYTQLKLGIPAIGGKDSMSGTFMDLAVPPTLVAFGVGVVTDVSRVISPEFKEPGNQVIMLSAKRDEHGMPDFGVLMENFSKVKQLIDDKKVLAAYAVGLGGVAEAVTKMCFGNKIGMTFSGEWQPESLFTPQYGSIILELKKDVHPDLAFGQVDYTKLGTTQSDKYIAINGQRMDIDILYEAWQEPLEKIFPTTVDAPCKKPYAISFNKPNTKRPSVKIARPRIFMPVFPGTNGEYDMARAFEREGGLVDTFIFRNLSAEDINRSIEAMVKGIEKSQILVLPGGLSVGGEPDGSGKFITAVFKDPRIREGVMELLNHRDGLILGIGDGFHALIKLGLVPYGEFVDINDDRPTLTYNTIGRHVSTMVRTKVVSTLSPWLSCAQLNDIHTIPFSHAEGRFVAGSQLMEQLIKNGQIATQYVDLDGNPCCELPYNPSGSMNAVEGITSPDGRVLGKMGHSERIDKNVAVNVPGQKDQGIFRAGVRYFL
ncbi:MAG TPA: phosphoribosylformylglycinamidine synthase [Clostridiales bacterium]|nr:phosphoribosylformylglycinamidine synthase [Clostridiales bacterium]